MWGSVRSHFHKPGILLWSPQINLSLWNAGYTQPGLYWKWSLACVNLQKSRASHCLYVSFGPGHTAATGIIEQNGFCVLLLKADPPSSLVPRWMSQVDVCLSACCDFLCVPVSDLCPSCKVNWGKKPGWRLFTHGMCSLPMFSLLPELILPEWKPLGAKVL